MNVCARMRNVAVAAALVLQTGAVLAAAPSPAEAKVLAGLRRAHPSTTFDTVKATPLPGLFEVRMGNNVVYVSGTNTRFLLFGHLFDTATLRDLTPPGDTPAPQPTEQAVPERVDIAALPVADAIKQVKGSGRRRLYLFTDPNCGYCRQLDTELAKLDDVTIFNFMLPMLDHAAPVAIWCAADRLVAWRQAMLGQPSTASRECSHPIDRNAALGTRLRIRGTPTMVFEDGTRLESAAGAEVIEARLSASHRSTQHD